MQYMSFFLFPFLLIHLISFLYFLSQASKKVFLKLTSSKPLDEKAVSSSMEKIILSTRKINKDVQYGVLSGSIAFEGRFLTMSFI